MSSFSERKGAKTPCQVLMLLTNSYEPDPRVRQEALALIRMGCRVKILAWDRDLKSPEFECMEGVDVERVFLPSTHGRGSAQIFFYAWLYLKMLWKAWRSGFDIVHCHDLDTLPIGFVIGKLKRRPIVYDSHESFTDMLEGSVHIRVRRALAHLENFFIRRVDLLITVGEKLRNHFVQRGARHSVVVGNWKRLEEYARTPEQNLEVRRRWNIPEDALTVICITQLLHGRKLEEFLDGVDECDGVYAIIGGRGILEKLVVERAAKNPRIKYAGFVAAKEIPAYTCASDVVFYGFDPQNPNARFSAPNKLFEALTAGRPLITGDFGEIADVARQESCGIVLAEYSGESIKAAFETLRDAGLRNTMARNAKRFGETEMNWQKGEVILHREYSRLVPGRLERPAVAENLRPIGAEVH